MRRVEHGRLSIKNISHQLTLVPGILTFFGICLRGHTQLFSPQWKFLGWYLREENSWIGFNLSKGAISQARMLPSFNEGSLLLGHKECKQGGPWAVKTNVHQFTVQPKADTNQSRSVSVCSLFYSASFSIEFSSSLLGRKSLIPQVWLKWATCRIKLK